MIYRVEIRECYSDVYFDFPTMKSAGEFVDMVLKHGYRLSKENVLGVRLTIEHEEDSDV